MSNRFISGTRVLGVALGLSLAASRASSAVSASTNHSSTRVTCIVP
jgi:hypothetical protein